MYKRHEKYKISISVDTFWGVTIGGDSDTDRSATLARLRAKDFSKVQICKQIEEYSSATMVGFIILK